jgi:serpin B
MNSFQIKIFKSTSTSSKGENLVISPLSIYHILSLAANGAVDDTKKEMLTALGNESQEEMNQNNKLIKTIINDFKSVEFANSIFSRITPLPTFIEKTEDYKAEINELKDENQINNWCSENTHGLIKKIVDQINPKDILVLINAIYFKGLWRIEFHERFTEEREFLNSQKEKKMIKFMHSNEFYKYFENNDIQAISLEYREDNTEALIILPKNENDINQYIKLFDQKEYSNIIKGLDNQKVELYLPKFEIKFNTELGKVLQELGIKLAFNSDADFSSMIKEKKIF